MESCRWWIGCGRRRWSSYGRWPNADADGATSATAATDEPLWRRRRRRSAPAPSTSTATTSTTAAATAAASASSGVDNVEQLSVVVATIAFDASRVFPQRHQDVVVFRRRSQIPMQNVPSGRKQFCFFSFLLPLFELNGEKTRRLSKYY